MRFLGIDLAWHEGKNGKFANDQGVVALTAGGKVLDAGWTTGLDETLEWVRSVAGNEARLFVDAPLVVTNPAGSQRLAEKQVGQRYGRWKVSANTTNVASKGLVGVALRERLEEFGWRYDDGRDGPTTGGLMLSECYPYTTLVGTVELGYDSERPRYKRKPRTMNVAEFRPMRAATCDDLIQRIRLLAVADPPLDLSSHDVTKALLDEPSPLEDVSYKHREDLIDAALCAWTASLWQRHGGTQCQVLGLDGTSEPAATIVAPARPEQRPKQPLPAR